jgi:hypothetical protein
LITANPYFSRSSDIRRDRRLGESEPQPGIVTPVAIETISVHDSDVPQATRRPPAREIATVPVEIEATELPGNRCGPDPDGRWYENIHVGLAKGNETEELVPGDAPLARWRFTVSVRVDEEGNYDFGGPNVSGARDERSVYLRWLREDDAGEFVLFRAAKFRLYEIDRAIIGAAVAGGSELVGSVLLTDENGWPRCATVREPALIWSVRRKS